MIRANSPGNSPAWRALLAILLLSVACSSRASACTIPVFRYALERWEADRFQVIVYHNGPLTAEQSAALERLEQQSAVHGGPLNIELIRYDLRSAAPPKGLLVDKPSADQTLPRIEVRARDGGAQWVRRWQGPMATAMADLRLWDSPARQEIVRRILDGHSAVWLVVAKDANEELKASAALQKSLDATVQNLPPPQGIGLPGSELLASVPLELRFSVLSIRHDDAAEARFLELLSASKVDWKADENYVIPIFGRCRALEVFPYASLDAALTEEVAAFICGACSCQVKQANPGFDLLVAVHWEEKLFGSAAAVLADDDSKAVESPSDPILATNPDATAAEFVVIPSGSRAGSSSDNDRGASNVRLPSPGTTVETQPTIQVTGDASLGLSLSLATFIGLAIAMIVVIGVCVSLKSRPET